MKSSQTSSIAPPAPAALAFVPETGVQLETITAGPLNHSRTTATDTSSDSTLAEEKALDVYEIQLSTFNNNNNNSQSQGANSFEVDLEAGMSASGSQQKCGGPRKSMTLQDNSDCQMWPGQDHWKQKAKAAKKERTCTPLASLSKRSRITVKVLIGILIIGIAVAVGFGVSKPLGASIWGDKHN